MEEKTFLSKEQEYLLSVCKTAITGEDIPPYLGEQLNIKPLIKESINQGVPMLFFKASEKIKTLTPDEKNYWLTTISPFLAKNLKNTLVQNGLVTILEKEGVSYAILKGTSSSIAYREPYIRALGDVDLYVKKHELKKVRKLLENNGYAFKHGLNEHHVAFVKDGEVIELHFSPVHIPGGRVGKIIENAFKNSLDFTVYAEYEGQKFKMLNPFNQGLVLLIHMQSHMMAFGVGLRHLCDWACYIQNTDKETQERLVEFFKQTGLFIYAKTITKTCAKYLGVNLPSWAKDADEYLADEIIKEILSSGNFGMKDKAKADSALLMENNTSDKKRGKFRRLISKLHHSVMRRYPFLRYLFIFYPFFFGYRFIRYFILILFGKRRKISELSKIADVRAEFYDKFKFYQTEKLDED